ncbi:hypothetical protein J7L48_03070 [bacterium]|nr:hypothetical protein [bacterium]
MEKNNTKKSFGKILSGLIIFLFIFNLNTNAEKLFWQNKKPLIAGFKSLIIPGLGQLSNKKYIKSGIFFALGVGGTFLSVNEYHDMQNEFKLYSDLFSKGDILLANEHYDRYINKYTLFQYTLTVLITFWIVNSIDAVFDAHFINVELDQKKKTLKLYIEKKF